MSIETRSGGCAHGAPHRWTDGDPLSGELACAECGCTWGEYEASHERMRDALAMVCEALTDEVDGLECLARYGETCTDEEPCAVCAHMNAAAEGRAVLDGAR